MTTEHENIPAPAEDSPVDAVLANDDAASAEPEAPREPLDLALVRRVLEAALLSAAEPLTVLQLKRLFAGEIDVDSLRKILDELKAQWDGEAVELTQVASGWRFRVRPEYQPYLD